MVDLGSSLNITSVSMLEAMKSHKILLLRSLSRCQDLEVTHISLSVH